jgi:hypothetical protein
MVTAMRPDNSSGLCCKSLATDRERPPYLIPVSFVKPHQMSLADWLAQFLAIFHSKQAVSDLPATCVKSPPSFDDDGGETG